MISFCFISCVIRLVLLWVGGKQNRGITIGHEYFFHFFNGFLLTFCPFHTTYLLVMNFTKKYNSNNSNNYNL